MSIPLRIPIRETEKPYVRIRGIYSTALTKIFLDNDFEIVQPSEEIRERFNLEEKILSPHIDIWDKDDKQGIKIETLPKYRSKIIDLFSTNFYDTIFRYEKIQDGSIYKGVIYRPAPWGGLIIKLTPNLEGLLPQNEVEFQKFSIGDTLVVEVKNPRGPHGLPLLSTKISIPGDYAVLIPEETVRISHKIHGSKRTKLLEIGHVIRPDGWGIIWRTSALYADVEDLKEEVERLTDEAEKLHEVALNSPALTKIREGLDILEVEFPANSKKKLDEIRSKVVPTVRGHHWYKSFSNNLTEIIDFSEKTLAKKVDMETLSNAIEEYVKKHKFPKEGDLIKIHHKKINGREIFLGPARLVLIDNSEEFPEFRMYRRFKPGGFYDGIEAQKEVGDYGITIAKMFDDKLITVYYDINNKLKGIYLNLNTPIEVYNKEVRYIDLEIDVVININGETKILDSKKLEDYTKSNNVTEKIYKETIERAEKYKKWLEEEGLKQILKKCEEVIDKITEEETEEEIDMEL